VLNGDPLNELNQWETAPSQTDSPFNQLLI